MNPGLRGATRGHDYQNSCMEMISVRPLLQTWVSSTKAVEGLVLMFRIPGLRFNAIHCIPETMGTVCKE